MDKQVKSNRAWAIVIGLGLMLSPIHNKWLTDVLTSEGEVGFFLPSFGYALIIWAPLVYALYNWKDLDWGDKRVYIPLLIIVGAIGLSGITADRWQGMISPLFMGVAMFALYLMAHKLGRDIFIPLAIGAGIALVGIISHSFIQPGVVTGGYLFMVGDSGTNYDVAVGYVLLGVALYVRRYQWVFAGIAMIAMFMCGSPEGVFVVGVMAIVVMCREDWGKRLVLVMIPFFLVVSAYFVTGYGQTLYRYTLVVVSQQESMGSDTTAWMEDDDQEALSTIGYRIEVIKRAMADIKPLGDGYNITGFTKSIVHNVPLIIVQQLGWPGIVAGIAWLWLSVWCLVKTRWKYVWVLILSLSVFDHFIWTQMSAWWWAIIGVTTSRTIGSDLLFKWTYKDTVERNCKRIKMIMNKE